MFQCYLVIKGRTNHIPVNLPAIPHRGDVIATKDHKSPYYLVHCVEFYNGFDSVNLHVQEFPNQTAIGIAVKGFRSQTGWL